jgi:hypothetical protein
MRILLGLLLAPVLATMPVSPALAQKKPEAAQRQDDMGTIIELLRSGKIQDALDLIDPMLARFEKTYADEKRLIFCAESTEEALLVSSAAQDTGKDVLVIDSDWCYALWAKGYALVDIHRVAEAVPYLERSVAMMPFNAQFMCELGNAYGELKQWDKAFATFERARGGGAAEGRRAHRDPGPCAARGRVQPDRARPLGRGRGLVQRGARARSRRRKGKERARLYRAEPPQAPLISGAHARARAPGSARAHRSAPACRCGSG